MSQTLDEVAPVPVEKPRYTAEKLARIAEMTGKTFPEGKYTRQKLDALHRQYNPPVKGRKVGEVEPVKTPEVDFRKVAAKEDVPDKGKGKIPNGRGK